MFGVVRRRLQFSSSNCNVATVASVTELGLNSFVVTFRLISSSLNGKKISLAPEQEENARTHSFTVSYLVDSCGLRLDSAESAAKIVALKTRNHSDEVLGILREYGFGHNHISLLVRCHPRVLLARRTTIVPKLEFLRTVGVSGSDIGKMVSWNPKWLVLSLENHIIPCHGILKSLLFDDDKVCMAMMRLSMRSLEQLPRRLVKNVSTLKEIGLPQSMISFLLIRHSNLACCKTDKLSIDVRKTLEYGFDPLKWTFVNALSVICQMSPKLWEHKKAAYKRWALSEDAIWSAFKKCPNFMSLSVKKVKATMDLLVNKLGWEIAEVVRVPTIFCYSFDKRIAPRCSVIETLMLRGFLKGKPLLSTILITPEEEFLKSFVFKYREKLPQLLSIFRGKTCVS